MSALLEISVDTITRNKQSLIFCNSKRAAEKQAEDLAKHFRKEFPAFSKDQALQDISHAFKTVVSTPTKQCLRGAFCISSGVAFHHAGLTTEQRDYIEQGFKAGSIKIICATPTLAAGLNMPAFRVVIKDLKRYGRWGMQYIPTLEYFQMAGRAGRPGLESYGEALVIAQSEGEKEQLLERYIYGEPEAITSKLAVEPVLRFHVLSLISSGFVTSRRGLLDFFSRTFYAKQFGDLQKIEFILDKVLQTLAEYGFINFKTEDFVSANEVDSGKISATPLGRRVSELYLDPYTANELIQCFKNVNISNNNLSFSLLHALSYTLEMRPLLRVKAAEVEDIHSIVFQYEEDFLHTIPEDYEIDEFLASVKTAVFFQAWIQETDEETLLERFDIRPGEIRAKLEIIQWLVQSSIELCKFCSLQKLVTPFYNLSVRLQYGAKEELLPLLKLKNVGRVRARLLFSAGFTSISSLQRATIEQISAVVGQGIATDIMQQLGRATVRKNSLKDFLD